MPVSKSQPASVGETQVDAVCQALFDAIFAQELLPGTKLSEVTVGTSFGVSRAVVRAVFNRLHNNSLVELKPNRGAFVATPSDEDARQVFQARICVEREVASQLAEKITDAQLTTLEAHVTREKRAHHAGDVSASIRLSGEFHLLAARMAGNDVIARFLGELISRSSLVLAIHGRHNASECGLDEHREILDALKARDPRAAATAMTRHLNQIVERTNLGRKRRAPRDVIDVLSRYAARGEAVT
jgi:DNA-binding GntR family transcriptional regulator